MDLETLLPTIRTLQDLPRLVAALGHQPLWDVLPAQLPSQSAPPHAQVTVVGRTGHLPWFALESTSAERDAVSLARRNSLAGRISLVLALDSIRRQLALSVGFDTCPVLEVHLDRPGAESIASLLRLASTADEGLSAFAARAADAFASETVGRRFFRAFRSTLDRMAASLPGPSPREARHGFALLQLTRVLFLYFIQTKGWLAGRDRFLSEEVDRCLRHGRRIHRDLLRPLFFGTLNQKGADRSRLATAFGSIPFLNGGLFEPHPLERHIKADIPNDLWREAFDHLFDRFHFTVAERDSSGMVAPDMLGRVFEGVMDPNARRASGTFYTPASLVNALLEAALITHIASRLRCPEREAERRWHDPDPATSDLLGSLRLLDPAVGSGAFMLGALESLSARLPTCNALVRKRSVLQQNLFGVDLSATAVRLTELRLWLAVIADDTAERPEDVEPLPNLDCLIRQGDSLLDPLGQTAMPSGHAVAIANEVFGLRRAVVAASGGEKRVLERRLRAAEMRVMHESLRVAEQRAAAEIVECVSQGRGLNLFGQRRGLDRELRVRVVEIRNRMHSVRRARRKLDHEGEIPWFHYQSHFADVFANGGFDLVVGNPPWLRSEEIPAPRRDLLSQRYRWWRGTGKGFGNRPDLSVAFVERALELAAPGATVAMLVPAKIRSARYGAAIRHALSTTTTLHVAADLTRDPRAVFEATVYPMALIAAKATPDSGHRVRMTLDGAGQPHVRQSALQGGGPWILVPDRVHRVLQSFRHDYPPVGDSFCCHLGVKTGANRVFLDPPQDLEPEVLRWAIRGRDVTAFGWNRRTRLLWTHDDHGNPRRHLPPRCAAYLQSHLDVLRARRDLASGPLWTVFRARPAVARHRVVWADLARQLVAVALTSTSDRSAVPLNSCYVTSGKTQADAQRLAAWLNSSWLRAAARLSAIPAASGFARFDARTISSLPLPASVASDSDLPYLAAAGRIGTAVQNELDEIAARHLNLSSAAKGMLRAAVDAADNRS